MVLMGSLVDFDVQMTLIDGDVVAEDGRALFEVEGTVYPEWILNTMHLGREITPETFRIPAIDSDGEPLAGPTALVRVIEAIPGRVSNIERHMAVPVANGQLLCDTGQDVLKAFVFERHHETGTFGYGFTSGYGIHGALAQTVAHDAHNLLVVGDNDEDMAVAANALVNCGGGAVAVQDGRVLGLVELPVAGLMSTKPLEEVATEVAGLERAWADMGCTMPSPFMTMGLTSLACLPDLRLTNRGLVDCNAFKFVPLVVDEE